VPRMTVPVPQDFVLRRDACSYGYFLLAPNRWIPSEETLLRPLRLSSGPVACAISQKGKGAALKVETSRTLKPADKREVLAQLTRMLRLDMTTQEVRAFHALDPRWKKTGEARLCRSPTLFEDLVKTVTSCNVTWSGTRGMNRRLCEVLGEGAATGKCFPTAEVISGQRPVFLRGRCGVGYRDQRLVDLARLYRKGAIDVQWLEDAATPTTEIRQYLLELPGIGPYAAANILQLLGRYELLPCDSESVRHGREVLGFKGSSAQVMKKVAAHFHGFGRFCFLSYWFELRLAYQAKHGPAHLWEYDESGKFVTREFQSRARPAGERLRERPA
jgi:3-methyladenine DNA glycosylase/8-oxoguanine DNA glycosylase